VAREDDDVVGQLEQSAQALLQQPRLPFPVAGNMQVRPTDVADQE
jgi:hypothetical protein